jgi:hypothetical protein
MNEEYTTKDIYLSAFLVARGVPLQSFERTNGRTTFRFDNVEELASLVNNFYADKAQVGALKYGNSLKNLKAMLYAEDTNTNGRNNHNTGNQN